MIYNQEIAEKLPSMFDKGQTVEEVCFALGISQKMFEEWKAKYPEFKHAAEIGEIRAQVFHEGLLEKAAQGEVDEDFIVDDLMEMMKKRYPHDHYD